MFQTNYEVITQMHFITNSNDCESFHFLDANWIGDNNINIRRNFHESVFMVVMQALESGMFHWDLRPANVLWRDNRYFLVIDWESSIPVIQRHIQSKSECYSRLKNVPNSNIAKLQFMRFRNFSVGLAIFLVEVIINVSQDV